MNPDAPVRYVVLHHTGVDNPHFDLMFESANGETLTTMRCSSWPIEESTRLERLPDHRRAYLEYEGPVSGHRGHVTRVASGTCNCVQGRLQLDTGQVILVPQRRDAGA